MSYTVLLLEVIMNIECFKLFEKLNLKNIILEIQCLRLFDNGSIFVKQF